MMWTGRGKMTADAVVTATGRQLRYHSGSRRWGWLRRPGTRAPGNPGHRTRPGRWPSEAGEAPPRRCRSPGGSDEQTCGARFDETWPVCSGTKPI